MVIISIASSNDSNHFSSYFRSYQIQFYSNIWHGTLAFHDIHHSAGASLLYLTCLHVGACSVRTHTSHMVQNRGTRYQKSAGLADASTTHQSNGNPHRHVNSRTVVESQPWPLYLSMGQCILCLAPCLTSVFYRKTSQRKAFYKMNKSNQLYDKLVCHQKETNKEKP